jgi:hypothetical protein
LDEISAGMKADFSHPILASPVFHAPSEYSTGNRTHHLLSGVRRPTEHLPSHRNYCTNPDAAAGGALVSNGSCVLQRSLSRCRRMRSTTRGSVIKETMRMRPPQEHRRGSASKIFLINRAHVLLASLEPFELSCSDSLAAEKAAVLSSGVARIGFRRRDARDREETIS